MHELHWALEMSSSLFLSFVVKQDKTLFLCDLATMPRQEEKRVNEQSTGGNMDLLVLGRVLLSSVDTLLSSSVIYHSVQAGTVLVLHVVSIMWTVIWILTVLHSYRHTHRHTHMHTPLHTSTAFRGKAKAKK